MVKKRLYHIDKNKLIFIKTVVFITGLVPLMRLIWLGFNDQLGANPIEFVERLTGFWSLFMLLVTLSMTPIRLITRHAWQLQLRRMLGLFMFFYACLHITTYLWLDYSFFWDDILADIIKHPYVLVGAAAFLLSIPLAVTSNTFMMRLLKRRWKQLHQLVYGVAILGSLHFLWLVKKDIREPVFYGLILITLLAIRIFYRVKSKTD